MAFRVPEYRERKVQQQAISGQKQSIDAPAAAFGTLQADAIVKSASAIERLGQQWNKRAIDIADENNELRALQMQTDVEKEMNAFLYDPDKGVLNQKGQNALHAPKMVQTKLAEIQQRFDALENEPADVRTMLQKSMIQMGRRYGDVAERHKFQEYTTFKSETLQSKINNNLEDIALNYMDDKEFQKKADENFKLLQSKATSEGWSQETLDDEKLKLYSQARATQITQMIATDDPQNILIADKVYRESRLRGQVGFKDAMQVEKLLDAAVPKAAAFVAYQKGRFAASVKEPDDVIAYVVDQLEGGDAVAQEPRGAIAKYGINSEANPSVDVANLTRSGAVKIYKDQYYKGYGVDEVPENMRLLAFDIAVNHRRDFALDMIDQIKKGADPEKIMDKRLREYQRLATEEPETYAKYYDGWKDRLNRISTQMSSSMPVDDSVVNEAARKLESEYKGAGAELIKLHAEDTKQKAAMKKLEKDDVQEQVTQIVSQNNGDWTKVPSSLRSKAAALDIDITQYKGVSDPETIASLDAMTSDELTSLDLNDPQIAQNLTYEKMQEYRKKQSELVKPENKYMADTIDGVVDYYFRTANKGAAGNPDASINKYKVASMKNFVSFKVEEARKAGKEPSKTDITKFASEYLTTLKEVGIKSAADIAEEERAVIEQSLLDIGIAPTNESVMAVYMNQRAGKK